MKTSSHPETSTLQVLLSWGEDLVARAVSGEGWNAAIVDDRAFGELMQQLGIEPVDCPRIDVTSCEMARTVELQDIFLFRCKNPADRSRDAAALEMVHQRVRERRSRVERRWQHPTTRDQ